MKQTSIIIMIIGIVIIIISQAVLFTTTSRSNAGFGLVEENVRENTTLKNVILIIGIVVFVAGGSTFASTIKDNSSINNGIMAHTLAENQLESEISSENDIKCSNCGKDYSSSLKSGFCQECGTKL